MDHKLSGFAFRSAAAIMLWYNAAPAVAQNLLSNGDFEQYSTCPTSHSELDLAVDWYTAVINPDFMHCSFLNPSIDYPASTQAASGVGFTGFLTSNTTSGEAEAIGQDLQQPLLPGETYDFTFSARIPTGGDYTNDCGVVEAYGFTSTPTLSSSYVHASTIPNAVFLGSSSSVVDTAWTTQTSSLTSSATINHIVFTFSIAPNCEQYIFFDDLQLVPSIPNQVQNWGNSLAGLSIFPNPTVGDVTIESNSSISELWVSDISGREVHRSGPTVGSIQLAIQEQGVYLITAMTESGVITERLVVSH